MITKAKICGLSEPRTLDAAVEYGAFHVGFVHFPKSPRHVSAEQAAMLSARVPDHVGRVGVFVDPEDGLLERFVPAARLSAIQLHGDETPERVVTISAHFGLPVWKAIPVRTRADLESSRAYRGSAAMLLFDAKPPKGADLPGGMGLRFDWRLLSGFDPGMPWGLSGGLDAANVGEAIAITGAPLVDVSSGVEEAPGVKSAAKIQAFMKAVEAA